MPHFAGRTDRAPVRSNTSVSDHDADEFGMVTAETAMVLPIVAAFVLALVWLISVAVTEIRLIDAARDAARGVARGDADDVVRAQIASTAPAGTTLALTHAGDEVMAEVSVAAEAPGWLLVPLPAIELHASATTLAEDGS